MKLRELLELFKQNDLPFEIYNFKLFGLDFVCDNVDLLRGAEIEPEQLDYIVTNVISHLAKYDGKIRLSYSIICNGGLESVSN